MVPRPRRRAPRRPRTTGDRLGRDARGGRPPARRRGRRLVARPRRRRARRPARATTWCCAPTSGRTSTTGSRTTRASRSRWARCSRSRTSPRSTRVPDDAPATLRDRVVGVQANVWTEHLDTRERLDYAVFPRLGAFAEVAWNGGPLDWDDFASRLPAYLAWLEAEGVDFRPLDGPRPDQQRPGVPGVAARAGPTGSPSSPASPPTSADPRRGHRHDGTAAAAAHPRARSRHPYGSKRYPSPGSLRKCRGSDGTSSSLRRSCATYRRR